MSEELIDEFSRLLEANKRWMMFRERSGGITIRDYCYDVGCENGPASVRYTTNDPGNAANAPDLLYLRLTQAADGSSVDGWISTETRPKIFQR